jgi:predicted RNase H-related nuclease YkuK (DUF458 family)
MRDFKDKFKKFGGDWIPDIIEYLKEKIEINPEITISVGCDSVQKRRKTMYALTIMLYNNDIKNGAHVVFFRESFPKIRDNFERLSKEALMVHDLAEYLNKNLESFYKRMDLNDFNRKTYKYHLLKSDDKTSYLNPTDVNEYISKSIFLTDFEKNSNYKLVNIHLDFNPFESTLHKRGRTNNKSIIAYRTYVPWLRSLGYLVWNKPLSFAASSAADLLLQD